MTSDCDSFLLIFQLRADLSILLDLMGSHTVWPFLKSDALTLQLTSGVSYMCLWKPEGLSGILSI